MEMLSLLLNRVALLALVAAGLATIVGARVVGGSLLRVGLGAFLLALFVPYAFGSMRGAVGDFRCDVGEAGVGTPSGMLVPVILGHIALAVLLIRRRLRGTEHARRDAAESERTRTRERTRLPPSIDRGDA